MADMADRQFDYEEPAITEVQRRRNTEDAYWCGQQRPCANCGTFFFEVDLDDGFCFTCKPPQSAPREEGKP